MVLRDKTTIKGEIADYYFDDGILVSVSKSTKRTIDNIKSNVSLVKELTNNQPVPLLIYLSNSPVPDLAAREFSKTQLPIIYKAMAMVSKPSLAKFIMNILFSLQKPPIPMKSFSNDKDAKEWLKQYL